MLNAPTNSLEFLRDIILNEMNGEGEDALSEDRVMFYNQKWDIPPDKGIIITIGFLSSRTYRNESHMEETGDGFQEVKNTNFQELLTVDIMSQDTSALTRKEELLAALVSQYGQSLQEKYSFHLGRIPQGFTDLSSLEASARLYRFQIVLPVLTSKQRKKVTPYYDSFTGRVKTEQITVDFVQPTEDPQ